MRCVSCRTNVIAEDNFAVFPCPACLEHEIIRCASCRRKSTLYTCACGFKGP